MHGLLVVQKLSAPCTLATFDCILGLVAVLFQTELENDVVADPLVPTSTTPGTGLSWRQVAEPCCMHGQWLFEPRGEAMMVSMSAVGKGSYGGTVRRAEVTSSEMQQPTTLEPDTQRRTCTHRNNSSEVNGITDFGDTACVNGMGDKSWMTFSKYTQDAQRTSLKWHLR